MFAIQESGFTPKFKFLKFLRLVDLKNKTHILDPKRVRLACGSRDSMWYVLSFLKPCSVFKEFCYNFDNLLPKCKQLL